AAGSTRPGRSARITSAPLSAGDSLGDLSDRPAVTLFVRHPQARRYLLRFIDERTIRVTLPRWGSKKEAVAFVEQERPWIDKQRRRFQAERARRTAGGDVPALALATSIPPDTEGLSQHELVDRARSVLPIRLNE